MKQWPDFDFSNKLYGKGIFLEKKKYFEKYSYCAEHFTSS